MSAKTYKNIHISVVVKYIAHSLREVICHYLLVIKRFKSFNSVGLRKSNVKKCIWIYAYKYTFMLILDLLSIIFDIMIMLTKCSTIWQWLNKLQYIYFMDYKECIKNIALCYIIKIVMI